MDEQAIYGVILIAYLVPYLVWLIARDQRFEILKQFYPGRADEKAKEQREYAIGAAWVVGFIVILGAWRLRAHPIPVFGIVIVGWLCFGVLRRLLKSTTVFKLRQTRIIIAGTAVWTITVFGWYLIFGNRDGFELREALLLVVVPLIISMIAYIGYQWAIKGNP